MGDTTLPRLGDCLVEENDSAVLIKKGLEKIYDTNMTTPKGGCLIGGWVFYQSYVEIYLNLLTLNLHFFGNFK